MSTHTASVVPSTMLSEGELGAYVADLAATPQHWLPYVKHDPRRRCFTELLRSEELEVWLVGWMAGHDTGWHDHGRSAGAVYVVSGAVHEQRMQEAQILDVIRYGSGTQFHASRETVHRVAHAGHGPTVTLHAYSPALRDTTAYRQDPSGGWYRLPMGQGQELRPL